MNQRGKSYTSTQKPVTVGVNDIVKLPDEKSATMKTKTKKDFQKINILRVKEHKRLPSTTLNIRKPPPSTSSLKVRIAKSAFTLQSVMSYNALSVVSRWKLLAGDPELRKYVGGIIMRLFKVISMKSRFCSVKGTKKDIRVFMHYLLYRDTASSPVSC